MVQDDGIDTCCATYMHMQALFGDVHVFQDMLHLLMLRDDWGQLKGKLKAKVSALMSK